jgi:broad specificity phosphatase PhoE
MSAIWLIRHGSTDWTGVRWCGRSDPMLTAAGAAQAVALSSRLSPLIGSDATILSSPARRALATASEIASTIAPAGQPPAVEPNLLEIDFGVVDGLTFDEIEARDPALASRIAAGDVGIDWPGGETAADVRARASHTWAGLMIAAAGSTVLAVSHGGLIAAILRDLLVGKEARTLHLPPAMAVRLDEVGGGWRIGHEVSASGPFAVAATATVPAAAAPA